MKLPQSLQPLVQMGGDLAYWRDVLERNPSLVDQLRAFPLREWLALGRWYMHNRGVSADLQVDWRIRGRSALRVYVRGATAVPEEPE